MEIILDTTDHCIETASKREYERQIHKYFKKTIPDRERIRIEQKIEILKYFLEHADFQDLRCQHSRANLSPARSVLVIPEELKHMHVRFHDRIFHPEWSFSKKVSGAL